MQQAATGFVVAGGRSRRMGRDKALLPWEGATLLDHAIARLRQVTDDVRILSGAESRYADRGLSVLTDEGTESGPLVGVLSGLLRSERTLGLFLAVDLPHVAVGLLRHLLSLADEADVVVPVSRAGPEPLCAVYSRACLEPMRAAVSRGQFKMTGFWADVRVRTVTPAELAAFGDPDRLFLNLNEPEDYEVARE